MELTLEEKKKYAFLVGKGGIQSLALIETLRSQMDYLERNQVGSEFLSKIMRRHAELMNRCYDSLIDNGEVESRDVCALREHLIIIKDYFNIISRYDSEIKKIKESKELNDEKVEEKKTTKRTRRPFLKQ